MEETFKDQHHQHPGFRELLEPLELAAGYRLRGKRRRECFAAFAENAVGFAQIVDEALKAGRYPLGLLVSKVREDQHLDELPPLPAREALVDLDVAKRPAPPPCPSCGIGAGHHLEDCELAPGSRNREEAA